MTIVIRNKQGQDDKALALNSESGGIDLEAKKSIHITSNEESDDAIKLNSLLGGIDMDTKKSIHITSNEASDDAIKINSKLGGIDIDANSIEILLFREDNF